MTDFLVQCANEMNILQLIAIGIIFWFFYTRLDRKIEKLSGKVAEDIEKLFRKTSEDSEKLSRKTSEDIEKLSGDIEKLSDKVEDIDRRLCRIEGSLVTQGHCLFTNQKNDKKAE